MNRAEPIQPHHQSNFTVNDIFTYMVKMPKINTSNLTDGQWVFERIQLLKETGQTRPWLTTKTHDGQDFMKMVNIFKMEIKATLKRVWTKIPKRKFDILDKIHHKPLLNEIFLINTKISCIFCPIFSIEWKIVSNMTPISNSSLQQNFQTMHKYANRYVKYEKLCNYFSHR